MKISTSVILSEKTQCQTMFLLWLTLLMLTAGVIDLDAYLDTVISCCYKQHLLESRKRWLVAHLPLGSFLPRNCRSAPSHLLAFNRAMHFQSHLSELGWLQRLNCLPLFPPLLSHIMPHNASLDGGQDPAEADQISGYSAIPAPRGARDTGWRSLFCHYSLEPLTAKKWFCRISAPLRLQPHHP